MREQLHAERIRYVFEDQRGDARPAAVILQQCTEPHVVGASRDLRVVTYWRVVGWENFVDGNDKPLPFPTDLDQVEAAIPFSYLLELLEQFGEVEHSGEGAPIAVN